MPHDSLPLPYSKTHTAHFSRKTPITFSVHDNCSVRDESPTSTINVSSLTFHKVVRVRNNFYLHASDIEHAHDSYRFGKTGSEAKDKSRVANLGGGSGKYV